MTTLKIEHHIARDNLGEADDDEAEQYVEALTAALQAEYPPAEITVDLGSDFVNVSQTFVTGAPCTSPADNDQAIRLNVGRIANLVWERL